MIARRAERLEGVLTVDPRTLSGLLALPAIHPSFGACAGVPVPVHAWISTSWGLFFAAADSHDWSNRWNKGEMIKVPYQCDQPPPPEVAERGG